MRDRVLLHLAEHATREQDYQAPPQVTQPGIAEAVGIRVSHVPQYLRPMMALSLVVERSTHVQGGRQRRKAYFLTPQGKNEAARLRGTILNRSIEVEADGERRTMTLGEAIRGSFRGVPLLELLQAVEAQGFLRLPKEGVAGPAAPSIVDLTREAPVLQYFYGRRGELEQLKGLLAQRPIVVLQGIPGIGKTTLAARLVEEWRGKRHLVWHQMRPWDTAEGLLRRLALFLQATGRPNLARYLQGTTSLDLTSVETILSRDLGGLEALLVFDDLQKASPTVVQVFTLLRTAMAGLEGPRLLLVTREFLPFYDRRDVQLRGVVGEMELGGLDPEAGRELLGEDTADAGRVVEAARGHPLLLELIRSGLPLASAEMDMARFLEEEVYLGLTEGERAIAKVASLYEQPVPAEALLVGGGAAEDLARLRRRGIVHQVHGDRYQVHDALRDHLRRALTPTEGASLSDRGAATLLRLGTEAQDQGDIAAALGLLQVAADVAPPGPSRGEALRRLGDLRAVTKDLRGALDDYGGALPFAPGRSAAALHTRIAEAYLALGDVTEALAASERAVKATPRDARARLARAEALLRSGNPAAALPLAEAVKDASSTLGPERVAMARTLAGQALLFQGRTAEGLRALEEGLRDLRSRPPSRLLIDALLALGIHRARLGQYPRARETLEEAAQIARSMDDVARESRAWALVGFVAFLSEDYDATLEHVWRGKNLGDPLRDRSVDLLAQFAFGLIEEAQCYASHTLGLYDAALAICDDTGDRTLADLILYHKALTWADAGDGARATETLGEARGLRGAGRACWTLEDACRAFEAGVHYRSGRWTEAAQRYAEALDFAAQFNRSEALHLERGERAVALARAGDLKGAEQSAKQVIEEAEARGLRRTRALGLQALGLVRASHGAEREADAAFRDALQLFDQLGLEPSAGRCRLDHGLGLAALGKKGRAREELEAAMRILDSNRMPGDLERAREALAAL